MVALSIDLFLAQPIEGMLQVDGYGDTNRTRSPLVGCSKLNSLACNHWRLRCRRSAERRVGTVGQVTNAGVADGAHVNADLVRAPSLEIDAKQARGRERLKSLVVRHALFAGRRHRPAPIVFRVAPDRRVDGSATRVWVALHDRVVHLVNISGLEVALERRVGHFRLGHDHQPARTDVQSMDDTLSLGRHRSSIAGTRQRTSCP